MSPTQIATLHLALNSATKRHALTTSPFVAAIWRHIAAAERASMWRPAAARRLLRAGPTTGKPPSDRRSGDTLTRRRLSPAAHRRTGGHGKLTGRGARRRSASQALRRRPPRQAHHQGRRGSLRQLLHLVALAAIGTSPTLQAFYERLRATGRPKKVAQVTTSGRLAAELNAMVRNGTGWVERTQPAV